MTKLFQLEKFVHELKCRVETFSKFQNSIDGEFKHSFAGLGGQARHIAFTDLLLLSKIVISFGQFRDDSQELEDLIARYDGLAELDIEARKLRRAAASSMLMLAQLENNQPNVDSYDTWSRFSVSFSKFVKAELAFNDLANTFLDSESSDSKSKKPVPTKTELSFE